MKNAMTAVIAVGILTGLAWADVAPNPLITGGATLTAKDAKDITITMVAEEVDLTPSPQKNTVTAVFQLKNTASKPVTLEVGFPSWFDQPLKDFAVEIDGKKQLAEVKKETIKSVHKTLFKFWMCWPMTFDKGQEHTVKVSYWVEMKKQPPGFFGNNLPQDVKDKISLCSSGYVMRTGAAWQGNIGKAVIRMHYSDEVAKSQMVYMVPKDGWVYDKKTNTDTLTAKDFKPVAGLGMSGGGGGGGGAAPGGKTDTSKKPNGFGDIFYTFGLCSEDQAASILEDALKQKILDPWAMEYLLDRVEKRNVLKLSNDELPKHVYELLEWMVPPQGPTFKLCTERGKANDPGVLSRGAEVRLQGFYRRVLKHYRDEGQTDKALAVASSYRTFLKVIADRDVPFFDDPANGKYRGGPLEAEARAGQKELAEITKFVDDAKAKPH